MFKITELAVMATAIGKVGNINKSINNDNKFNIVIDDITFIEITILKSCIKLGLYVYGITIDQDIVRKFNPIYKMICQNIEEKFGDKIAV
jgi:hypothetical protein